MSLDLDKRQRAMLREIGVRVWQPAPESVPMPVLVTTPVPVLTAPLLTEPVLPQVLPEVAPESARAAVSRTADAIDSIAGGTRSAEAASTFYPQPAVRRRPEPGAARGESGQVFWQAGQALPLYADFTMAAGPRWLVLAEAPASALRTGFNPFAGEAGKLLDNMLRAARLNQAGAVWLSPLLRKTHSEAAPLGLDAALAGLVAGTLPDVMLVMGRLAAQAVLQSSEPFGKLRGQVHMLHGIRTVVTHDAAYLLRTPLDKARAWDDLCLAMSVASTPGG